MLDVHLGRLAAYLRLLGFDCLYRNDYDDEELLAISRVQHRILFSRDTGLLKRAALTHGAFLHATDPRRQLREVCDRFQLDARIAPFTRCARCNGKVEPLTCRCVHVVELARSCDPPSWQLQSLRELRPALLARQPPHAPATAAGGSGRIDLTGGIKSTEDDRSETPRIPRQRAPRLCGFGRARFFKTRALAKHAIETGKIEIGGQRAKPARGVHIGEAIKIARGEEAFEIVVLYA